MIAVGPGLRRDDGLGGALALHIFSKYPKGILSAFGIVLAGAAYFLENVLPLVTA